MTDKHKVRSKRLRKFKLLADKIIRRCLNTPLPEVLFLTIFILARYQENMDHSYPGEIFLVIGLMALLAGIVFYLYKLYLKQNLLSHMASLAFLAIFWEFKFLEPHLLGSVKFLVPKSFESRLVLSTVALLLIGMLCPFLAWGIGTLARLKRKTSWLVLANKLLMFTILFVFSYQALMISSDLMGARHQLNYRHPEFEVSAKTPKAIKPDIYYLVMDRYTNQQVLKDVYQFNNSDFLDFLANAGFTTNNQAYANYPFTTPSVASTLAMDYFNDFEAKFAEDNLQTPFPYRQILENPPLVRLLRRHNYEYNLISPNWDFTRVNMGADRMLTPIYGLKSFGLSLPLTQLQYSIISRTAFDPFLREAEKSQGLSPLKYQNLFSSRSIIERQMSAIRQVARQDSGRPQFTFAHILAPHPPYSATADGKDSNYNRGRNDLGIDEYQKYTNQLQYLNILLKKTVRSIVRRSPEAVIILQADEGPYPKRFRFIPSPQNLYDPASLPDKYLRQKFGILASYRLPNISPETISKQITSPVNAFRAVLVNYLGYDLAMLPACHFSMGSRFSMYDYQLVNNRLDPEIKFQSC